MRSFPSVECSVFVIAALAGCVTTPSSVHVEREVIGRSLEGRPIEAYIVHGPGADEALFDAGSGVETLLIFGGIHGNETLTVPLVQRLLDIALVDQWLASGKRLVIVPAANPDGLARGVRHNSRGVDLNRNFPASNWKRRGRRHGVLPASEPETRALMGLVERYRPARVLSVHAPLHCVNYDGPAHGVARAMATASGYELRSSIGYQTPGSFGNWAGVDRRIPVVTLELRRDLRRGEVWDELGNAVLTFVRYPAGELFAQGDQLSESPSRSNRHSSTGTRSSSASSQE